MRRPSGDCACCRKQGVEFLATWPGHDDVGFCADCVKPNGDLRERSGTCTGCWRSKKVKPGCLIGSKTYDMCRACIKLHRGKY
jgi:hypothetical protein